MALEFTPDDAKALISDPTSSLCGNFVNTLLKVPVKFYQLVKHLFDADGNAKAMFEPGDMIYSFVAAETEHRKLCNGQALSTTTYAILYAKIGSTFDTMDGQSAPGPGLFRVPKCGARFACAVGTLPSTAAVTLGGVGGEETHVLLTAEMPEHQHDLSVMLKSDTTHDNIATGDNADFIGAVISPLLKTDAAGEDTPHNTMPPYFGAYVFISTGI